MNFWTTHQIQNSTMDFIEISPKCQKNRILPCMSNNIRFTPIGGVGQIGSNMSLVEADGARFIIDSGILFPYEDFFDLNYLIPDMSDLGKIDRIIITHGHEDHIGAIAHFRDNYPDVPIHTPKFAALLMAKKLREAGHAQKFEIYKDLDEIKLTDSLSVFPVRVDHSIPDTHGLLICDKKSDTALIYASDFKVDNIKSPSLTAAAKRFSTFTHRVALFDSTNMTSGQDKTLSEDELYEDLKTVIEESSGRVFLTAFASNVDRIQTVNKICSELRRPMVMIGRSMKFYTQTAAEEGYLKEYSKIHYDWGEVLPDQKNLVCLVSGCQGDFKSATRRIITDEDSSLILNETDTFIFSSKTIPGNEKKLSLLENKLSNRGVRVIKPGKYKIHASGHACKEDLKLMYQLFKPTHVIPIHGESTFLDAHIEFAKGLLKDINCYRLLNFRGFEIEKNGEVHIFQLDQLDPILIHGKGIEIERSALSERRKMACNGVIFVSLNLKSQKYFIDMRGLPKKITDRKEQLENLVKVHLNGKKFRGTEDLRVNIRRFCQEHLGYKPVTLVQEV
ncbi:MAG: ribonuclease J [Deltaproteobacteria bacterium]|nr:MAG: ribonuclease J [Deltaproteobacteria bacterium]